MIKVNGQTVSMAVATKDAGWSEGYALGLEEGKAQGAFVSSASYIAFAGASADDATYCKNFPNMDLSHVIDLHDIFVSNKAVGSIGDIYAPNAVNAYYAFQNSSIRSIGKITFNGGVCTGAFRGAANLESVTFDCRGEITRAYNMFNGCFALKKIGGNLALGTCADILHLFCGCKALVEIEGELDFSAATSTFYVFLNCTALEKVGFVPGSIHVETDLCACGKLNAASRQSIKNGLADLTGQTQQTIKFHSDVLAKYTDDEIAEMLLKNWAVE